MKEDFGCGLALLVLVLVFALGGIDMTLGRIAADLDKIVAAQQHHG